MYYCELCDKQLKKLTCSHLKSVDHVRKLKQMDGKVIQCLFETVTNHSSETAYRNYKDSMRLRDTERDKYLKTEAL